MGIKTPYVCEIAPDTYAINEFGLNAMFLCVGSERALLIDTGTGVCDLKAEVAKLTDKPYDVVITHGHVDHAGGMGAFDKVYIHEKDVQMAKDITVERRKDYAETLGKMNGYNVYDYSPDMVKAWDSYPEFVLIDEGYVFDLGDRSLEVFFAPGHTPGSITLLDRKNRIHFSGDACNGNTLCLGASITTLYHTAEKLKALEPYFDQDFNGHHGYAGVPSCLSQKKSVRDDVMEICRQILKGTANVTEQAFLGGTSKGANYGNARVVFNDKTPMIEEGEVPVEL
ncbi:MAG: MBL fold metallo-hydrolase [Solobacterium sp.]|nr:MBL fold metallo-hydrolase [Solobacterium sp.]